MERRFFLAVFFISWSLSLTWASFAVPEGSLEAEASKRVGADASSGKSDILEIKGPVSVGPGPWPILGTSILVLVAGLSIWYAMRKNKERGRTLPPRPACEVACEALAELKKKDLVRKRRIQDYYLELSNIVRGYLRSQFNLPAQMTTEEYLLAVKDRALSLEQLNLLGDFLNHYDLVKFACYTPYEGKIEELSRAAERIIGETSSKSPSPSPLSRSRGRGMG